MLAVHEVSAGLLDVGLELVESVDPSSPASLHIAVLLHGDHSEVVFLVDPDLNKSVHLSKLREERSSYQEVLLVVVPDTSGIGPVSRHTSRCQERRDRLVEEEVVGDELLLCLVGHFVQWEVLALMFSFCEWQAK